MKILNNLKKILIISGKERSGKTTSIKILRELLENDGFQENPTSSNTHSYSTIKSLFRNDEFKVLEKNDIRIGIISEGDYCEDWIFVLSLIFIFKCSVVVCAMRTKNQKRKSRLPISVLSTLLKEAPPLIEIVLKRKNAPQTPKSIKNQTNQEFTQNLYAILTDVLKG